MYDLLIQRCILLDPGAAGDPPAAHDLAIQGQRIAAVQPAGSIAAAAAHELIDGAGWPRRLG
ncbi:MAG: hypothetical protein U0Z44_13255 [Kouleothrix sp.]